MEHINTKIYQVNVSLLSEWWHCDKDCTEDEIVEEIYSRMQEAIKIMNKVIDSGMTVTKDQVRQRLFGGFGCNEGGYHVCHATGHYTYSGPNYDLSAEDRKAEWLELMQHNMDDPFTEGAPFTSDYPGWENK